MHTYNDRLMTEINDAVPNLTSAIMGLKLQERLILEESARSGGPSSTAEAISNLMGVCKLGMRELARQTNMSRKKLKDILEGKKDPTVEIVSAVYDVFKARRPDLFE